jgi:CheY-like chemotaxis protein
MENEAAVKRVLVVDDEKDVQDFVCLVLEDTGFAVDCAGNGREALEKIESARPDLVLLDLMMPEMDGWSVLDRLKRIPDAPAVVILSAFADEWRALRAGAWESLPKPFLPQDLVDTCRRALDR